MVWIGRYLCMDNDYGEHIFDNWEEHETIEEKARKLDYQAEDLLILNPDRFQDKKDGPCHPSELRKRFWRDLLDSLHLSLETLFEEARHNQKEIITFYAKNPPANKEDQGAK